MARILCDGNTKVTFVPAIADISAPKAATELSAASAVDLQDYITPDGANVAAPTEAVIDASVLSSTADFEAPGRYKLATDLTMQRDDTVTSDKGWTTMVRGTKGFLVVRRNKPAGTAYAVGDVLEVYTVTVGKRTMLKPAKNMLATFSVHLYHSGADNDNAVAVA